MGGTGKTSLSLTEAVEAAAAGLNVLVLNFEDTTDVMVLRVTATHIALGAGPEATAGRLFVEGAQGAPAQSFSNPLSGIAKLRSFARRHRIDIAILDPWVSVHGGRGSVESVVQAIVDELKRTAISGNFAIGILAHPRKTEPWRDLTEDDLAGSLLAANKMRDIRVLNPMRSSHAKKFGVEKEEMDCYFRIDDAKHTHRTRSPTKWIRKIGIDLGNGGVPMVAATRWEAPSVETLAEDMSPEAVDAIKEAVAGGLNRADKQSKGWAGKAVADVLGLDTSKPAQKATAAATLASLIEDGHLRPATGKVNGRDTPFIEPVDVPQSEAAERAPVSYLKVSS